MLLTYLLNHQMQLYLNLNTNFTAVNYKGMRKGVEEMFSIHTKEK